MRKRVIGAVLTLYLGFGVCLGLLVKASIPAVNAAGVAYVTVAWPGLVKGAPIKAPIPSWAFSFGRR